ncbi:hypothetical protein NY588_09650 [Curtobacterium flaccumfaciens pv. beticola]|uniref:hypothetical protein n=1 Tax=Curtobacterium flaccumfaciens TaxID=2035 RepID=UPI00349F4889|nr:hypothetical protein [Curtobacterium flaccumfaciens pv. basellae]
MTTTAPRYNTAFDALELAPDLIEHIASLIPMQTGGSSEIRTTRVHAPTPLNVDAFDTVNRLSDRIRWWAAHWATMLQVPKPENHELPTSLTSEPARARAAVYPSAQWLLNHLEEIFRRTPDTVNFFIDELTEVHQAAARYPMLHQPRYTQMRCRNGGCDGTVALWPFVEVKKWQRDGQHVFLPPEGARILCDDCGDRWTEAEYTTEVNRQIDDIKQEQKSQRVARQLMKKYGPPSQFPMFFGAVAGRVRHGSKQKMVGDTAKDLTDSAENPLG